MYRYLSIVISYQTIYLRSYAHTLNTKYLNTMQIYQFWEWSINEQLSLYFPKQNENTHAKQMLQAVISST